MKPPKQPPPKPKATGGLSSLIRPLFSRPLRYVTLPALCLAAMVGGTALLWRQVGPRVAARTEYQLTSDALELTPLPSWIHTNIADEVLRQLTAGGPVSVLDEGLPERVYQALAVHPWIAKVVRVEKQFPARVRAEVIYRRPVCMVEVPLAMDELPDEEDPNFAPGDARPARHGGLYPVDAGSVLLPTADFSRAQARRYPRLSDIHTLPLGPVGTAWGDARVAGGAEIAAALANDWERLKLHRIAPSEQPQSGGSSDDYSYDIIARDGTRIVWGQRPSSTFGDEVSATEKVSRLHKHLSQGGTESANPSPAIDLDIRYETGVSVAPRTAKKSAATKTK
ncbi:MAG: hypothetical protein K1X71_14320 [Pirellulales bacterium]|nr:hypothetical protein [Pirellulales bacterium]